MAANDAVKQCVQQCTDTANKLRSMANSESNMQVKNALIEGAHHLDLCVTECQYSIQQMGS
ncbi:MAG: hypothetical protein ACM3UU_08840 [Ignavibacteriales bacterium]